MQRLAMGLPGQARGACDGSPCHLQVPRPIRSSVALEGLFGLLARQLCLPGIHLRPSILDVWRWGSLAGEPPARFASKHALAAWARMRWKGHVRTGFKNNSIETGSDKTTRRSIYAWTHTPWQDHGRHTTHVWDAYIGTQSIGPTNSSLACMRCASIYLPSKIEHDIYASNLFKFNSVCKK